MYVCPFEPSMLTNRMVSKYEHTVLALPNARQGYFSIDVFISMHAEATAQIDGS